MNFELSLSNRGFFHIRSSEQVFKSIPCPSSLSLRSCPVLLCFSSRSASQCTWRQSQNYTSVADSQRQHNIVLIIVYWRHENLGLVHTETLRHRFGCRKRMMFSAFYLWCNSHQPIKRSESREVIAIVNRA